MVALGALSTRVARLTLRTGREGYRRAVVVGDRHRTFGLRNRGDVACAVQPLDELLVALKVAVELTNTGSVAGAEVVQLYIAEKNPTVLRPNKELKAIKKVTLEPGKKSVVTFDIDKKMCSFWCDKSHSWYANAGEYEILIGTSSADIAATLQFVVE